MNLQSLTLFQLIDRRDKVLHLLQENEQRYYTRYTSDAGELDYSASTQDDYNGEGAEHADLSQQQRKIETELTARSKEKLGGEQPAVIDVPKSLVVAVRNMSAEYISWLKRHPDVIDSIHWEAFEQLVADIFASNGFTVELTGRMRNNSSDVLAVRADEFGVETKYLIECKRYKQERLLGVDIVNGVIGAKQRADADHAFLVTTSSFTRDVKAQEYDFRELRLHLRDGADVQGWLSEYSVRSDGGLWLASGWNDDH